MLGLDKTRATRGQKVERGRLYRFASRAANGGAALVVRDCQDDVGTLACQGYFTNGVSVKEAGAGLLI